MSEFYIGKYLGKSMCGFDNGKEYNLQITKNVYGYLIEDKNSNAAINYASENSINRNWTINVSI